jgi:predicted DNA-binding transcriptional regulator YafY
MRLPQDRMSRLWDVIGDRAMESAERLDEPDEDGWVRLRVRLPWPDEVPRLLLGVGSGMEILGPPEIRDRLIATAERIVERYRASGSPTTGP